METTGCRWTWMGNVYVLGWGYMGNVYVRGCRLMGNGGWTYWSNREWRKPQTKTNIDRYYGYILNIINIKS